MEIIKKLDEKISKTMIIAISILLVGSILTYYQNKINKIEVPQKVTAVVSQKTINKGDIIDGSHLKEIELYKPDKHPKGINDMSKLIGKIALTTIVEGKEITEEEITTKENWFKENKKEIGITFNNFTDVVGGKIIPGDIVDIMVSYPSPKGEETSIILKEPELVVENIRIEDVLNENNMSYRDSKDKDSFKPYTILVWVTNEQEAKIDVATKMGRIYLRRHGNYIRFNNQEESTDRSKIIITGN